MFTANVRVLLGTPPIVSESVDVQDVMLDVAFANKEPVCAVPEIQAGVPIDQLTSGCSPQLSVVELL